MFEKETSPFHMPTFPQQSLWETVEKCGIGAESRKVIHVIHSFMWKTGENPVNISVEIADGAAEKRETVCETGRFCRKYVTFWAK